MKDISHKQIFFVLIIAIFIAMMGVGVISPTIPIYAETLGASGVWLGMMYAAFSLSRLIFMPIAGRLSDIKGRKVFMILGLAIYSAASFGYIWSGSMPQLTVIRFIHGIGSAMVIPIASAVIGDISPQGHEGRLMGNFQVALFLGFGAGPLLGGFIMEVWGINSVFLVMGCMSILSFLLILFLLPEIPIARKTRNESVHIHKHLWAERTFQGLFMFRCTNAIGRAVILSFLPVFANRIEITSIQIGFLVSLNILLTAILQKFTGQIADRTSRTFLIVFGNAVAAVSIVCIPLSSNFVHLILWGIIMGIGSAIAFPAAGAVATTLGRDYGMGHVMGQFNMAMSIGSISGALMAGFFMDLIDMNTVFIISGGIGLAGSLGSWKLMGEKAKDQESRTKN